MKIYTINAKISDVCIFCYLPCRDGLFVRWSSLLFSMDLLDTFLDFLSVRLLSRLCNPVLLDPELFLPSPIEVLDFFDPTLLDLLT